MRLSVLKSNHFVYEMFRIDAEVNEYLRFVLQIIVGICWLLTSLSGFLKLIGSNHRIENGGCFAKMSYSET